MIYRNTFTGFMYSSCWYSSDIVSMSSSIISLQSKHISHAMIIKVGFTVYGIPKRRKNMHVSTEVPENVYIYYGHPNLHSLHVENKGWCPASFHLNHFSKWNSFTVVQAAITSSFYLIQLICWYLCLLQSSIYVPTCIIL